MRWKTSDTCSSNPGDFASLNDQQTCDRCYTCENHTPKMNDVLGLYLNSGSQWILFRLNAIVNYSKLVKAQKGSFHKMYTVDYLPTASSFGQSPRDSIIYVPTCSFGVAFRVKNSSEKLATSNIIQCSWPPYVNASFPEHAWLIAQNEDHRAVILTRKDATQSLRCD